MPDKKKTRLVLHANKTGAIGIVPEATYFGIMTSSREEGLGKQHGDIPGMSIRF